jgi:hypothetical protein
LKSKRRKIDVPLSDKSNYIYPTLPNGKKLNYRQRIFCSSFRKFFKIENIDNWFLKDFYLHALNRDKNSTVDLIRLIYEYWLTQLLQESIIDESVYQIKHKEAKVKYKFLDFLNK